MKILLCTPISLDIIEQRLHIKEPLPSSYGYPLASYLSELYYLQGHDLHIVTSTPGVKKLKIVKSNNLTLYIAPRRRHYLFCLDFYHKEISEMIKAIKIAKPDIVHAQWTYEFALAAIKSGYPYLVTARDDPNAIAKLMGSAYRYYRLFFGKYIISRINNISFISPYLQEQYGHYKSAFKRTYIIPNGLQKKMFVNSPKKISNNRSITFGVVSGTGKLKNALTALMAMCKVIKVIPDAKIIFIGSGLNSGCDLELTAQQNNLSENVEFLGIQTQNDIFKILQTRIDIFLHTSLEESFGMTVLEAMACGLPVIGGKNSGAIPWLLDYGKAGALADCTDIEDTANVMLSLATNCDLANSYAVAGWKRGLEMFTLDAVSEKYIEAYSDILK